MAAASSEVRSDIEMEADRRSGLIERPRHVHPPQTDRRQPADAGAGSTLERVADLVRGAPQVVERAGAPLAELPEVEEQPLDLDRSHQEAFTADHVAFLVERAQLLVVVAANALVA